MEFIIQADAKVKYEGRPCTIVPGARDVQEIAKFSEEERTKAFAGLLDDCIYSLHIAASENDLNEGTNKLQYDLAKGASPSSPGGVFRSIVWLSSADLRCSTCDRIISG